MTQVATGSCPLTPSAPLSTGVHVMSGTSLENCIRGKEGYKKERGRGDQRKHNITLGVAREKLLKRNTLTCFSIAMTRCLLF